MRACEEEAASKARLTQNPAPHLAQLNLAPGLGSPYTARQLRWCTLQGRGNHADSHDFSANRCLGKRRYTPPLAITAPDGTAGLKGSEGAEQRKWDAEDRKKVRMKGRQEKREKEQTKRMEGRTA